MILLVSVTSAQVSHPASEITFGAFGTGDFIFQDNLKVIGNINITTTTSNAILSLVSIGIIYPFKNPPLKSKGFLRAISFMSYPGE